MIAVLELVSFADVSQYTAPSQRLPVAGRATRPVTGLLNRIVGSYLCTWQNDFSDAFNFKPWIQIPKYIYIEEDDSAASELECFQCNALQEMWYVVAVRLQYILSRGHTRLPLSDSTLVQQQPVIERKTNAELALQWLCRSAICSNVYLTWRTMWSP